MSERMNLRVGASIVFLGLALCLAYVVRASLLLIFVSIIFAIIFSPWISWIQRWRIGRWSPGRGASILILLAMVVVAISVFLAFAVPPIAHDAAQLAHDMPRNLAALQDKVAHLPLGHAVAGRLNEGSLRGWIEGAVRQVFSVFHGVLSGLLAFVTLVLLTAYFILDGRRAFRWAMAMVPTEHRDRLADALRRSAQRMQRWLYGQIALMAILGSASAIVFGLLGVRYFYALAVFAGLANFVPIIGPIASVVLAGVVAALDSWTRLLGVLIFYLVYQQVENAFLTPRIMRSAVDLPGVAVIVALTIGGELAGLLGAIVAVPTAALVATLVNEYLVHPSPQTLTKDGRAA